MPGAAPSLAIGDPAPHVKVQAGNLPIGATFSPVAVGGFATPPSNSTIKGYHSVFEWTPTAADVGWHSICVYLETNFSAPSSQVCFDVSVQPDPAPEWITTNSATFTATMGKELLVTLEAIDLNPSDNITIEGVNLPDGAVLSPPVFEQRPVGLVTVRNLTWVPGETMGGLGGEMCVRATDDGSLPGRSANSPADLCFQYIVPKCRYSVGGAEGLVQVASRFKTNWLQLWALNKDITRPGATPKSQGNQWRTANCEAGIGGCTVSCTLQIATLEEFAAIDRRALNKSRIPVHAKLKSFTSRRRSRFISCL